MAKLPFKSSTATQVPTVNTQSSVVQKTKRSPIKIKSSLYSVKNKLISKLPKSKNSTLAVPGVPVQHSKLFYSNTTPGVKPSIFQKAKLAFVKAKSSVFSKPVAKQSVNNSILK